MDTFLDLLIVVVLALVAVSFVAIALMFLVKNRTVKRVCLYIVALLGIYISYVGCRILWPGFVGQGLLAVALGVACAGAVVLERVKKADANYFLAARILAAVALLCGMFNAFVW